MIKSLNGLYNIYSDNINNNSSIITSSESISNNLTISGTTTSNNLIVSANKTTNNLTINNLTTISETISANNNIISATNLEYCDATSSVQTQINNLSSQLYTTTGGGFFELLFETTSLTYGGTYNGYIFGSNLGSTYGYYIGTNCTLYSIGIQVSSAPTVACTIYILKNNVQLCPITLSTSQTSNTIYPNGYSFSKGDYISFKQVAGICGGAKVSVGFYVVGLWALVVHQLH
jgi:hypothetical protein